MASILLLGDSTDDYLLVLNDPWAGSGITQAQGDARYLKLAADNDPLTGTLSTQVVIPDGDNTRTLGSTSARWAGVYSVGVRANGGSVANLSVNKSGNVLGHVYKNGTNGTARLRAYNSGANYNAAFALGEVRKSNTNVVTAEIAATGAGSLAGGWVNSSAGAAAITASGRGGFAWGSTTSSHASVTRCEVLGGGSGSMAVGTVSATSSGGTAAVETTNDGTFALGRAQSTGSGTSRIQATQVGSFAAGQTVNGTVQATGQASFAHGYASQGTLQATGIGSFANGKTYGYTIAASGDGSFVSGLAYGGNLTASGHGSFAVGYSNSGAIVSSANNAAQFGPGTNALALSLQVGQVGATGTGLQLCGGGAPGTKVNGQIWVNGAGNVVIRSAGVDCVITNAVA